MASVTAQNGESRLSVPGWMAGALVVFAVILVYWNTLHAPFLFDDTGAVLTNPTIRHLDSLAVLNPPGDGSTTTGRPLVNLSFAINFALSGENVWSYHLLNIAIHALAALALMGIVRRTLSCPLLQPRFGTSASELALIIAVVWAVHPLLTESVTCIAQRTESLCSLFYLLTLYGFIRSAQTNTVSSQRRWCALSILACLAGMATKEIMVTIPVIIWLYDRTFVSGGFLVALRKRWGYYLPLASTWLLLGWLVTRGGGGRGVAAGFGLGISSWSYLLQQCHAILLYLKLSVWPHPLVLDYGTPVVHSLAEVAWQGITVVILLATTLWAVVRKPSAGFCGAFFFIVLSPSSSVVPLVTQTMAEHRMYLPLTAVISAIVLSLYQWLGHRVIGLLAFTAILFGLMTVTRNHDYRDNVVIWQDTVEKCPTNARARNNLAWAFQQRSDTADANLQFARAVDLQPGYVSARYNWGVALLDQGRVDAAIAQFEAAVRLAPAHADARVNLGNALMQVQRAQDAVPQYEAALLIKPDAGIHYDLGVALIDLGQLEEAAIHFRTALQLNPTLPEAHYQLAKVAEKSGKLTAAELEYTETLRLAPEHVGAHRNLGLLLAGSDRLAAAAGHFAAVVRLKPDDANAYANLGNVYLLQGNAGEAVRLYQRALELRPNDANFRASLDQAREAIR